MWVRRENFVLQRYKNSRSFSDSFNSARSLAAHVWPRLSVYISEFVPMFPYVIASLIAWLPPRQTSETSQEPRYVMSSHRCVCVCISVARGIERCWKTGQKKNWIKSKKYLTLSFIIMIHLWNVYLKIFYFWKSSGMKRKQIKRE